jgi:DNA-binding XRE family transcriptional regulator
MTAAELIAWRDRLKLSQVQAAKALGCSRRSIQIWENGTIRAIPGIVPLACAAISHGIPGIGEDKPRV